MIWIRPSGSEIETNDSKRTIEYCKSLGWKVKGEKVIADEEIPKPAKKKVAKNKAKK